MKAHVRLRLAVLLMALSGFPTTRLLVSQDHAPLPPEAAALLKKYETWETRERAAFEGKLAEERSRLVSELQRQLEQQTGAGNLAAANAIQAEIQRLSVPGQQPPAGMEFQVPWEDGPGNLRITFHEDGTASQRIESNGRHFPRQFRWRLTAPGVVEFWWHQNVEGSLSRWDFREDFRKARVRNRKAGKTFDAIRIGVSHD